jgi:hypothetical protein
MGLSLNSTVILTHDTWSGYLSEAQKLLPSSASRLALLAFINIPLVAVLLNVLRQLVSFALLRLHFATDLLHRSFPKTRRYHRKSSTSYPLLDPRPATGTTLSRFSSPAAKR